MLMSLTDPQTITIAPASAVSLPRTSVEDETSEYTSADGLLKMTASHQETGKGRHRRQLRIDVSKISADPYKPTENVEVSMSIQLIFDVPKAGFTAAEQLAAYVGFKTQFAASSDAVITKLIAGES